MLRPWAGRERPGCSKPAFRKELKNRRDLATSGHSPKRSIRRRRVGLIANEVVGAHRAAKIGPTARLPVIDEADFANISLEPLRFA
jgi:hypothetical protein